MNPLIEQHDKDFLMYTKNKSKLLVQHDTTVSLLVDEIHLNPYIDYNGGNIVGLSDNNNETATSAFTFILSSVFSQYKGVVHVMPTKSFKAENLFDIVKCIIFGLEEIDFQVLSIITDNAINKKAISFNCIVLSFKFLLLFFLFHILKDITNNWICQKDANKCMLLQKFCHNGNHQLSPKCPILYLKETSCPENSVRYKMGHFGDN